MKTEERIKNLEYELSMLKEELNNKELKFCGIGDRFTECGSEYLLACCEPRTVVLVNVCTGAKASTNPPVKVNDVYNVTKQEFDQLTSCTWDWKKTHSR